MVGKKTYLKVECKVERFHIRQHHMTKTLLFVTFIVESYLHILIIIYDNFLCAER